MVIQESDDNLLLSCEAHGKETYFNIKKMEKKKNIRGRVQRKHCASQKV